MTKPAERELLHVGDVHRQSIITRLREAGHDSLTEHLARCGQERSCITCLDCGRWRWVFNRCDSRWCPTCGPLRARRRAEELAVWIETLKQPKHLVLTSRNVAHLTRRIVNRNLRAVAAIRRRKLARGWKSGTWTMELTNEGRGWHLHFHLLVEAKWIDMPTVSRTWAGYLHQDEPAICKVKDARASDYLHEVAKYIAKPAEVASWDGNEIAEAMLALKGRRSFGVFGELNGQRQAWKQTVKELRRQRAKCPCGSCNYSVEPEWLSHLEQRHRRH